MPDQDTSTVVRPHAPADPGGDPESEDASRPPQQRTRRGTAPPVLVEVMRGQTVESRHRGHIVLVGAAGAVEGALGSPATEVMLRSTAKPFALVALIESGAADDLALTPPELAIMAGSHTGEDKHVRTLQGIFRRASVTQSLLRCGTAGAPTDARTATRLARDGETPGAIRHQCSGFHAASILISAHAGWSVDDYADPSHPSQQAVRKTVARLFGRKPETLRVATDDCGLLTYEVTLLELARAYLLLADPEGPSVDGARSASMPALRRVRDAMTGAPDMVGGTYDSLDTALMQRRPGRLLAKGGEDGLQAVGVVAREGAPAAALAIKVEDGDPTRRATDPAAVEALAQLGLLDDRDLRALAAAHHPVVIAPGGREAATALPRFVFDGTTR